MKIKTIQVKSSIYQFFVHNFDRSIADAVNLLKPQLLILRFELLNQMIIHLCHFFVDVSKMVFELALCQQIIVQIIVENSVMLFLISPTSLSPDSYLAIIPLRQGQVIRYRITQLR